MLIMKFAPFGAVGLGIFVVCSLALMGFGVWFLVSGVQLLL